MSLDGTKNATSFIVLQGYIVSIGHQCTVNSPRSGIYKVKFKNKRLPDNVKLGAYITLIGQLVTLDLGRAFVIIKAEPLRPGTLPLFKKFLQQQKIQSESVTHQRAEGESNA